MKIFLILTLVVSVNCATNWVAGFSSLTVYAVSGAGVLWQTFIDKCQEFEDNGGTVRGINCVSNSVFYLIGAAAAIGADQAGAMYILNQGVTTERKRDALGNSTAATRSWDWPAIHSSPDELQKLLANGLPKPVYNHSDFSLDNPVTVFVESDSGTFAHSSNVTNGIVAFSLAHPTKVPIQPSPREVTPDGTSKALLVASVTHSDGPMKQSQFRNEVWNFVNWTKYGNQGSTYDLEWSDNNRYETPYVAGRLILEIYGSALSFKGAPGLNECVK